eukprot:1150672-Pelagomonas_calceolata.AAC.1
MHSCPARTVQRSTRTGRELEGVRSFLELVQAALKGGTSEQLEASIGGHHWAWGARPQRQPGGHALLFLQQHQKQDHCFKDPPLRSSRPALEGTSGSGVPGHRGSREATPSSSCSSTRHTTTDHDSTISLLQRSARGSRDATRFSSSRIQTERIEQNKMCSQRKNNRQACRFLLGIQLVQLSFWVFLCAFPGNMLLYHSCKPAVFQQVMGPSPPVPLRVAG